MPASSFLSDFQKQELSELAESIAENYCPRGMINPELIAETNSITYSYGEYENDFDGLIEHEDGRFHIYINNDRLQHPYTKRARFTFAHELGHYYIDAHRNALKSGMAPPHSSFTNFSSEIKVEREADYFASCLLLPESRLKADCFRRKFHFRILEELSEKYQTSLTATALRFSQIGNHPIMVVCSQPNRIKWYWYSNDFPFKALRHGKAKVPEDTTVGESFIKQRKFNSTQQVFAMDWFANVWDSDINRKFYEHCIYRVDGSVLSVIWED